jgi:hypothetical protein
VRHILVIAAAVLLGGCSPSQDGGSPPPKAPETASLPSCREAWAALPEEQKAYDFARDARPTPDGNTGYEAFAERIARESCVKPWTVLIYMAADNADMPPYAYWHLHSMEAAFAEAGRSAASSLDADVLVQLDLNEPGGIRRLHMMPGDEPYGPDLDADDFRQRTPADIRSPVAEKLEEETIPPEESLWRFLDWGLSEYPAERTLVIVWGHGLGWRPADLADNRYDPSLLRGGIAFDDHPGTVLDTPDLRSALARVSKDRLGGRPVDVYASDACLMQSLEVATELSDVSRYVVGSEQIEDYLGFPYRTFLPALNGTAPAPRAPADCAGDEACAVAAMLPVLQREAFLPGGLYADASPDAAESFTLSAARVDLVANEVRPAMHALGAAITEYVREEPLRTIDLQVLLDVPRGADGGDGTPGFLGGARDVGVFLEGLRELVIEETERNGADPSPAAARLLDAIASARTALGRALVAEALGAEYNTARHAGRMGASVWLPHDAQEFEERIGFFASSQFYDPPGSSMDGAWPGWLELVFAPEPTE